MRNRAAVNKLLAACAVAAAQRDPDEATRKRLALCAVEVAHQGAWDAFDEALGSVADTVQDFALDALEFVVEHPVLVDSTGKTYNARLFLLPISQRLQANVGLKYLPQGEVIQDLLTQAFCPNGIGVLVNQFLPEDFLLHLSLREVWDLSRDALAAVKPGSADAPESIYLRPEGPVVSGLHFVPFVALVPSADSDELLGLEGDDLAVRSLSVMEAIQGLIAQQLTQDREPSLSVCTHLIQPFFYDELVVALAHESYIFACELNVWRYEAHEAGTSLALQVRKEAVDDYTDVVVEAWMGQERHSEFRFPLDADDLETEGEVCAAIFELVRPHDIPLTFGAGLALPIDDGFSDSRALGMVDAPTTLQ